MLNKRIIIDLSSPKVRKNILTGLGVLIVLIAAFVYFTMPDDDQKKNAAENQISISDSGIKSKDEKKSTIYVDVSGAVKEPSVILLAEGSRVFEAIEAAGGLTEDANLSQINRAEVIEDGSYIYIPTNSEVKENSVLPGGADSSGSNMGNAGSGQGKININTADSTELQELNGVGPATAEKIIAYRNSNGNFSNIEEIKNVSGIGDKTYEKLAPDITV